MIDLKTRKIDFMQEFFRIENEEAISRFEELLEEEKLKSDQVFEPMTMDEFNQRIDQSLEDIKHGRIKEVSQLLSEIKNWS